MKARLALWLYSRVMRSVQPLLRRKLKRRGLQEPGYLENIEERFGYYNQPPEADSSLIWVHAVSLGETRTAAILLKALREAHPGLRILLTHGTATGRAEGRVLLQAGDVQAWQPWDTAEAVERFFTQFKPRLGLLMETEVWPNAVLAAKVRNIPLVLVNARLSAKSLKQAQAIPSLSEQAYAALSAVYAQTADEAGRFRLLGAQVEGVFGNLKYDATPSEAQQAEGKAWRQALGRPVLMFASSREGEETGFLEQFVAKAHTEQSVSAMDSVASSDVQKALPRPAILIVPRHPQRFDEVQALIESCGLIVSRRSAWDAGPAANAAALQADVWLGDSLGEMAMYYALSDVALLGGSFAMLGGQNLIEAAACACPVVMGPHTFNFTEAAEMAASCGAAQRVPDMREGVQAALGLIADTKAHANAAAAGLAFAASNRGATAKTVQALSAYLRIAH